MTFEQRIGAPPAEPAPLASPAVSTPSDARATPPDREPVPVALRLQILSTEHWSLLSSRSLAWNESFARAGMYLSTLSGGMVALALVAGVEKFGDAFFTFAIVILPVILFVGVATFARLGGSNYHDAIAVTGMNRIRAAYLELAPELAPYFVMGVHDDPAGIGVTMAVSPRTPPIVHLIAATPFLVSVLNSVVAGVIVGIVASRLLGDAGPAFAIAVVGFVVVLIVHVMYARGAVARGQAGTRPMFPTPAVSSRGSGEG
jgi:hypothetical protein